MKRLFLAALLAFVVSGEAVANNLVATWDCDFGYEAAPRAVSEPFKPKTKIKTRFEFDGEKLRMLHLGRLTEVYDVLKLVQLGNSNTWKHPSILAEVHHSDGTIEVIGFNALRQAVNDLPKFQAYRHSIGAEGVLTRKGTCALVN
ncbi:hypothetical protein OAI11_00835 [Rhodospirillales bacterium]|nr:hypothetical protein [Rhodospirillales bacterium]